MGYARRKTKPDRDVRRAASGRQRQPPSAPIMRAHPGRQDRSHHDKAGQRLQTSPVAADDRIWLIGSLALACLGLAGISARPVARAAPARRTASPHCRRTCSTSPRTRSFRQARRLRRGTRRSSPVSATPSTGCSTRCRRRTGRCASARRCSPTSPTRCPRLSSCTASGSFSPTAMPPELLGVTPEQLVGRPVTDLVRPAYRAMTRNAVSKRLAGEILPDRMEVQLINGQEAGHVGRSHGRHHRLSRPARDSHHRAGHQLPQEHREHARPRQAAGADHAGVDRRRRHHGRCRRAHRLHEQRRREADWRACARTPSASACPTSPGSSTRPTGATSATRSSAASPTGAASTWGGAP